MDKDNGDVWFAREMDEQDWAELSEKLSRADIDSLSDEEWERIRPLVMATDRYRSIIGARNWARILYRSIRRITREALATCKIDMVKLSDVIKRYDTTMGLYIGLLEDLKKVHIHIPENIAKLDDHINANEASRKAVVNRWLDIENSLKSEQAALDATADQPHR